MKHLNYKFILLYRYIVLLTYYTVQFIFYIIGNVVVTYQFSRTVMSGCTLVVSMRVIRSANLTEAFKTSKPLCFENPTSDTVSKRFAKSSSTIIFRFTVLLNLPTTGL